MGLAICRELLFGGLRQANGNIHGINSMYYKHSKIVTHPQVMVLTKRYRTRHLGWNVKHFYAWYRREGGGRSYSWVSKEQKGPAPFGLGILRFMPRCPRIHLAGVPLKMLGFASAQPSLRDLIVAPPFHAK
jgi:hypothetical protein